MKRLMLSAPILACALGIGAAPVRILPMGDSITHGYWSGINIPYDSYRKTLKSLLEEQGDPVDFVGSLSDGDFEDNQHEGHDGWFAADPSSTNTLLDHASAWMTASGADIVLLHIGTNDILADHADASEVSAILDMLYAANSNATVVLALIINADPAEGISADISTYNSNLAIMATGRINAGDDLIVVDMEHGAGLDYTSAEMIGIHPSPAGYDRMATNWFPAVAEAVARQRQRRAPVIMAVAVSGMRVFLEIGNLTPGEYWDVQRSPSIGSPAWHAEGGILPAGVSTTWTGSADSADDTSYYRLARPL